MHDQAALFFFLVTNEVCNKTSRAEFAIIGVWSKASLVISSRLLLLLSVMWPGSLLRQTSRLLQRSGSSTTLRRSAGKGPISPPGRPKRKKVAMPPQPGGARQLAASCGVTRRTAEPREPSSRREDVLLQSALGDASSLLSRSPQQPTPSPPRYAENSPPLTYGTCRVPSGPEELVKLAGSSEYHAQQFTLPHAMIMPVDPVYAHLTQPNGRRHGDVPKRRLWIPLD